MKTLDQHTLLYISVYKIRRFFCVGFVKENLTASQTTNKKSISNNQQGPKNI
jgi:hypothetical protein